MITQITTCKGRFDSVKRNIGKWLETDIGQLVLVDFACPQETGLQVARSKYANDPRLIVMTIAPEVAGPFYSHAFARNTGVYCARYENILFMDADCIASNFHIKSINNQLAKNEKKLFVNMTEPELKDIYKPEGEHKLPPNFHLHGQIAITSSLFYDINGFNEEYEGWGGETYDLILRSYEFMMSKKPIYFNDISGGFLRHQEHDNDLRNKYLATSTEDLQASFQRAMTFYAKLREVSPRAQPGKPFGHSTISEHVTVYKNKSKVAYAPGQDIY